MGLHACTIAAAHPWYYIVDPSTVSVAERVVDVCVPCKEWALRKERVGCEKNVCDPFLVVFPRAAAISHFDTLSPPLSQMAISDYDADATELLETYGAPRLVRLSHPEGRRWAESCGQTSS
jgi:hypothetical protein